MSNNAWSTTPSPGKGPGMGHRVVRAHRGDPCRNPDLEDLDEIYRIMMRAQCFSALFS